MKKSASSKYVTRDELETTVESIMAKMMADGVVGDDNPSLEGAETGDSQVKVMNPDEIVLNAEQQAKLGGREKILAAIGMSVGGGAYGNDGSGEGEDEGGTGSSDGGVGQGNQGEGHGSGSTTGSGGAGSSGSQDGGSSTGDGGTGGSSPAAPRTITDSATQAASLISDKVALGYQNQAADAQERTAPTMTAAQVGDVAIGDVADAAITQVGAVDPVTGVRIADAGQATAAQSGGVDALGRTTVRAATPVGADGLSADQREFRAAQSALVGNLQSTVEGDQPSVAELQLQQGQEENARAQLAAAASARGEVNPALIAKATQDAIAASNLRTNQDAATLRAQEQAQARGELAGVLGQARETDVSVAAKDAELSTTVKLANLDADLKTALVQGDIDAQRQIEQQRTSLAIEQMNTMNQQQAELANLQARMDQAIAQGDLDMQAQIANQQTELERALAQSQGEVQTRIANMEKDKQLAIEQENVDLAISLQQAQLEQEASITNLNSELEMQALNDQMTQFYEQLGFDAQMAQAQAALDIQQMQNDFEVGMASAEAGVTAAREERQGRQDAALLGAGAAVAGAMIVSDRRMKTGIVPADDETQAILNLLSRVPESEIMLSDARQKENITPATDLEVLLGFVAEDDDDVLAFLDELEPYSFNYTDPTMPGAAEGEIIGIMAQDAEKSRLGRRIVMDGDPKRIDVTKGLSLALASAAHLNRRMRAIEE